LVLVDAQPLHFQTQTKDKISTVISKQIITAAQYHIPVYQTDIKEHKNIVLNAYNFEWVWVYIQWRQRHFWRGLVYRKEQNTYSNDWLYMLWFIVEVKGWRIKDKDQEYVCAEHVGEWLVQYLRVIGYFQVIHRKEVTFDPAKI